MRFFALSVFTSLVFGIFCSATPTPEFAKLTVRAGTETLESVLTDFANNVGNPITENLSEGASSYMSSADHKSPIRSTPGDQF